MSRSCDGRRVNVIRDAHTHTHGVGERENRPASERNGREQDDASPAIYFTHHPINTCTCSTPFQGRVLVQGEYGFRESSGGDGREKFEKNMEWNLCAQCCVTQQQQRQQQGNRDAGMDQLVHACTCACVTLCLCESGRVRICFSVSPRSPNSDAMRMRTSSAATGCTT